MKDLITEARELIEALHAGEYDDEYIGTGAYLMLDELCDALEKATAKNDELIRELSELARESVKRDVALAKLEAEVMAIREAMASVHKSLDFADALRQSSKNYTELAINNGLALGQIAVALKYDFKQPLPAPPEEGAEHERD